MVRLGNGSELTTAIEVTNLDGNGVVDRNNKVVMDIVIANFDTDNQIFLNVGDDPLSSFPSASFTTVGPPRSEWQHERIGADWQLDRLSTTALAVADFTGDGIPDIITAQDGAANYLYVGSGSGGFSDVAPIEIALPQGPSWYESDDEGSERRKWGQYKGEVGHSVAIAPLDVDGDGDMDVMVSERDMTARVYFNDGSGTFTHRRVLGEAYALGPLPVGVVAVAEASGLAITADLNGDGYPDIVTATHVFVNPGSGDFHNVVGQRWRPARNHTRPDCPPPYAL